MSTSRTDWALLPSEGSVSAPDTGPFPYRPFLETAWTHHQASDADLVIASDANGAVALAVSEDGISFAGPEYLTDYHSPLGDDPMSAIASALSNLSGSPFRFDSLPYEAVGVVTAALDAVGATHATTEQTATAVLKLPASFDEWLMDIGKKERHEVRRKRRRFEEMYGAAVVANGGTDMLAAFADMHRCQPGDKGKFMTERMEAFFGGLMTDAGAVIHTLTCRDRILAAAFGFETDTGYFYYNSAFEPDAAAASPGVVLLSALVENQIERGATVFDFLKGEETYKYRHGAERRQLYSVDGRLR